MDGMGGSDSRSPGVLIGALGLWIGSLALLVLLGLDLFAGNQPPAPGDPVENWIGTDIAELLGPLVTLEGDSMNADVSGLRLWVLIEDRECLSCLDELPVLHFLTEHFDDRGVAITAVALGDRHEARRTLLGLDPGMPILVSTQTSAADVLDLFVATRTPLRVLTWYGRVVEQSSQSVLEEPGESRLVEILQRWSEK